LFDQTIRQFKNIDWQIAKTQEKLENVANFILLVFVSTLFGAVLSHYFYVSYISFT